ncbi:hypothetical protein FO519_007206 [Halicephalobus sp. NKZ332]|nr:hypothetical protein FO519_007206 [Halicephalobus sp. NKZ332]
MGELNSTDEFAVIDDSIPFCNICLGSTDPKYLTYNMAVSGVLMAFFGVIGLVGNLFVVMVYGSRQRRVYSTSIYLAALGASDFCLILTAMFLFVLEAWRHHGYPNLAYLYGRGAPFIFPLGAVFQTTSIYYCVAAAVDCFIDVVLPSACKNICCTAKKAKYIVAILSVLCILYNIPHCFEIESVLCIDQFGDKSLQICPTDIRMDPIYYTVYYTYMYTTFLAVGPLLLLVVLNICVVATVATKKNNDPEGESDTISLVLVVFMFIFCNFNALLINFLELTLYEQLKGTLVYLVDMSNFLIVINGSCNFFIYLIFGKSFRESFFEIIGYPKQTKPLELIKTTTVVWEDEDPMDMTVSSTPLTFNQGN